MDSKQMMKTEVQCIEEHAPKCQASCPLHVQMRSLINLVKTKAFDEAALLLQKQAMFPRLIAAMCPAPCERACKRAELDDGIAINAMEKAIVAKGALPQQKIIPYMKINKTVAIVGGGVSGMAVAWFLYEKGFNITVFEKTNKLGGKLLEFPHISEENIALDFVPVTQADIEFHFNTEIGKDISYEEILEQFDSIYISGAANFTALDIELKADPKTLQNANPKIFIGGSILREGEPYSVVQSINEGRRAAISMDRFLKKVSLTAARYHEEPYETELYTDINGVEKVLRTPKTGGEYTDEELQQEAKRCLDCHCLVCVRECKFLKRFGRFPRLYIREIANTISLLGGGSRSAKNLIVACTLCGLCKELCPNSIQMPEVIKSGRQEMVKKNELSPAIYDFPVRDMLFSNSDEFSLCKHAPQLKKSEYLFFPGCQMAATMSEYISPCYDYLLEKLGKVGLFLGCCGAPADWAGQEKLFNETMAELIAKWQDMGEPTMIVGCTTCYQQFKAARPEMKLLSLWEVFAEHGLPEVAREPKSVAVHDTCTARHEGEIQEAVRQILDETGYKVEELEFSREKTRCCGYGGLVFYGDKKMAKEFVQARAEESKLPYVAYCSVCRDFFVNAGKPAYHILDIIWGKDSPKKALQKGANISQKEANRIKLKQNLLQKYWHEKMPVPNSEIKLFISDEVKEVLEERLITETNIRQVIAAANASGKKLIRPADGHFIIVHKPGIITYWVEYLPKADGFEIFNAYSHRIHISED
ncbi:MAG: FAD-dependent oxidoreductase [Clostridia bacterium]|nr:FAD-dependent oxidoreductase [Clostridia bacterium]